MPELFLSYAPNAEDVVVWRALGALDHGRYLDLHISMGPAGLGTKGFHEQGWRGVHVVTRADQAGVLRRERPEDVVATAIEARTVDELLDRAGVAPGGLHVCYVDVGAAGGDLPSFDLGRWRPWVVVVSPSSPEPSRAQGRLADLGYRLCLFDGVSRIYASPDHVELAPQLAIPVSVLDVYEPAARHARRLDLDARGNAALQRCPELEATDPTRRAQVESLARAAEEDGLRWRGLALHEMALTEALRRDLAAADDELEAVRRSPSWRLSRPLRQARARQLRREARRSQRTGGDGRSPTTVVLGRVGRRLVHRAPMVQEAAPTPATSDGDVLAPGSKRSGRPSWTPEERTLAGRLGTVGALLAGDLDGDDKGGHDGDVEGEHDGDVEGGHDLGDAVARFERALRATTLPDATVAWLAWTAVHASVPGEDELDELSLRLALRGRASLVEWVCTEAARALQADTAPMRRLRLMRGGCIVDVTHTAGHDYHTGVQRVVRETVSRWWADQDIVLFGWNFAERFPSRLDSSEVDRFLAWNDHAVRGPATVIPRTLRAESDDVLIPWGCTLIVPEIAAEKQRTDAYRLLLQAKIVDRLCMIVYDLVPMTIRETVPQGLPEAFATYLALAKRAQRLSAISESTAGEFRSFVEMLGAQGLAGPTVVAHPLPSEVPAPGDAALEKALEKAHRLLGSETSPMVLVVGSHEPRKNHVVALLAAERLWREDLEFHMVFIGGSGWRGERFDSLVAELVADGRPIQVLKRADEETLWAAYRLARFSVFPSLTEGFGLPVAESLESGTPVITSDFGSMAEIGRDGGAVLVDPRSVDDVTDAMRALLVDDAMLARLEGQTASRPTRTWDDYARDTWTFFAD